MLGGRQLTLRGVKKDPVSKTKVKMIEDIFVDLCPPYVQIAAPPHTEREQGQVNTV